MMSAPCQRVRYLTALIVFSVLMLDIYPDYYVPMTVGHVQEP